MFVYYLFLFLYWLSIKKVVSSKIFIKKEIVVSLIIFLCLFELVLFGTNMFTFEVDMKYSKIFHPLLFILVLSAWGSLIYFLKSYTAHKFLICMLAITLSICVAIIFSANVVTRILFIDGNVSSLNIIKSKV